ncbi:MAG: hypothetical protein ACREL6_13575 [Gemmatimonadales bacterium]
MKDLTGMTWANLPRPVRTVARWLTLVQTVGYTVSLIFVYHTTRLLPHGAETRYRGVDPGTVTGAMQFPKPLGEMLTSTHTHVLAMAAIFAFSGFALALCQRPSERWRRFLIAEPFAAILVTFTSIWLMRYVEPRFSLLLFASSGLAAVTFYVQTAIILVELHRAESP